LPAALALKHHRAAHTVGDEPVERLLDRRRRGRRCLCRPGPAAATQAIRVDANAQRRLRKRSGAAIGSTMTGLLGRAVRPSSGDPRQ
jgi:hypothetical protein